MFHTLVFQSNFLTCRKASHTLQYKHNMHRRHISKRIENFRLINHYPDKTEWQIASQTEKKVANQLSPERATSREIKPSACEITHRGTNCARKSSSFVNLTLIPRSQRYIIIKLARPACTIYTLPREKQCRAASELGVDVPGRKLAAPTRRVPSSCASLPRVQGAPCLGYTAKSFIFVRVHHLILLFLLDRHCVYFLRVLRFFYFPRDFVCVIRSFRKLKVPTG